MRNSWEGWCCLLPSLANKTKLHTAILRSALLALLLQLLYSPTHEVAFVLYGTTGMKVFAVVGVVQARDQRGRVQADAARCKGV